MRMFALVLVLQLSVPLPLTAQDSSRTRLDRIEYVLGSSAIFSLIDYLALNFAQERWNISEGSSAATIYHACTGLIGAGINYLLYKQIGLSSAIAFDLIWWTWGDDLGYMAWSQILNPPSPWPNRSTEHFSEEICCASSTPAAMMQQFKSFMPRSTLFAQAAVGLTIALAIVW